MMQRTAMLVAAITLGRALGVQAEEKNMCPQTPATQREATLLAGQWFAKGEKLFEDNRFDDAMAAFVCSLGLKEHENTVFNLAHTSKFVENRAAAVTALEGYLNAHPDGALNAELKKLLAELKPAKDTDSASPVASPAQPAKPAEPAEPEQTPESDVQGEKSKRQKTLKVLGWTAIGVGAAAGITGGVLFGLGGKAKDSAVGANSWSAFDDSEKSYKKLRKISVVGFSAAGALLATGVVLLLLSKDNKEESAITVGAWSNGVALIGEF